MPLLKTIRHGFVYWEAPHSPHPLLPELEIQESKNASRLANIVSITTAYRKRKKPDEDHPGVSILPMAPPEIVNIQEAIIQAFNLTSEEFYGRNRTEKVAAARIASMALCRVYTQCTVEEIAAAHHRHHRVVCHATCRFAELQRNNRLFAAAVIRVETTLLQKAA